MSSNQNQSGGLEPRRVPPADDVEGHVRFLMDEGKEQSGGTIIRPDDAEGHSRFGMFIDAAEPVQEARKKIPPADEDVEGHRRIR